MPRAVFHCHLVIFSNDIPSARFHLLPSLVSIRGGFNLISLEIWVVEVWYGISTKLEFVEIIIIMIVFIFRG